MMNVNKLSQEVADFASKLGLNTDGNLSFRQPSQSKSSHSSNGPKQKRKTSNKKSDLKSKPKKNPKSNDSYDKEALLRILSGPEENTTAQFKRLRKAHSILSPSAPLLWHVAFEALPELTETPERESTLSDQDVQSRKRQAQDLCQNEKDAYDYRLQESKKHGKWLLQVREKGTHGDKIAALSLHIRDAVVANVSELDVLLSFAEKQKGSKELVINSLQALTELFRCYLLPNRKLIFFEDRPLQVLKEDHESKIRLLYWFVEDFIKRKFAQFVSVLETTTLASLDHLRSGSVTMVSTLLYEKPEQEAHLLRILIYKLGDKSKSIGSKVAHLISKLLDKHPRMKLIVFRECEKFVYLPGTTMKCVHRVLQLFTSITYSQNETDKQTATKLVNMCFTLLKLMMDGHIGSTVDLEHKAEIKALVNTKKRKKEVHKKHSFKKGHSQVIDGTILGFLVSGIRRSLPFADKVELGTLVEKHLDALYKLIHTGPIGVGIQVLSLLLQILYSNSSSMDRFYRALYEKILDPSLSETRKLPLFLSTLFKAMKEDTVLSRINAFVKRLLQIAQYLEPHIYCAFLVLISELIKFKPGIKNGIMQLGPIQPNGTKEYEIGSREPTHCGADQAPFWEICLSLKHYHPVACSIGNNMLSNQPVEARGDPFQDLTLFAFLEKFVLGKEAKTKAVGFGGELQITPRASLLNRSSESKSLLGSLALQDVPIEDTFFHKYFSLQGVQKAKERRQIAKQKKKGKVSEQELEGNVEMEEIESLEGSDYPEVDIDVQDVDDMFQHTVKKQSVEMKLKGAAMDLFGYSDLMQTVENAYEDSLEAASEELEQSENEINLPTSEFPDSMASSEEDETDSRPIRKKAKKRRNKDIESDFAPLEDFEEFLGCD